MPEPDQQIVAELARELVTQAAPQELPLFRATSQAYFKAPQEVLKPGSAGDEMLGFGLELATFVTPSAMGVASAVVTFLFAEVRKSAETESSDLITDLVRRMFKKLRPASPATESTTPATEHNPEAHPPTLTPEILARVRQVAFEKARESRLPESQAALLADSVVGSLVTSPS